MPALDSLERDALIQSIRELQRRNEQLRQLEALLRKQDRSAAPFSKGSRQEHPKTPRPKAWRREIPATFQTGRQPEPVRRLPASLREMTGIEGTQGALTQDAMKQAEWASWHSLSGVAGAGTTGAGGLYR